MRFVFRADAYANSGAGHVMRTSALAEELIANNYDVVFIGNSSEIPWVEEYVSTLGFSQILDKSDMFTPNPKSDVLILDSYTLLPIDAFIAPNNWFKIIAFVDESSPPYLADLYIDATLKSKWTHPETSEKIRILEGIEYIQIRKSLRQISMKSKINIKLGTKILVVGGGSDPFNFVGELYKILSLLSLDFQATLITLDTKLSVIPEKFSLALPGSGMMELLEDADLVFSTAGTSSWEFIYLGLPLGIASAIENQNINYEYQTETGLAVGIGFRGVNKEWIFDASAIYNLISNPYVKMREPSIVDGKGVLRLYNKVMELVELIN